ncbi:hypothetical protein [uncultured Bacteroides sp.]|nr:hypothetical protein [uncultured Bacteroides sp.]
MMDEKRPYPYCKDLQDWEKLPQMGIEPVCYKNGMLYIKGSTWTEQSVEY